MASDLAGGTAVALALRLALALMALAGTERLTSWLFANGRGAGGDHCKSDL